MMLLQNFLLQICSSPYRVFCISRHGCLVHSTISCIYIFTSISSQIFLSYRHVIQLFLSCFFAVYLHLKRTCAQHKLMEMAFSAYILKDMHPELDHLNTSFSSPGCIFKLIIQTYKTVLKKLFLDQYNDQETVGKDVKFFRYL